MKEDESSQKDMQDEDTEAPDDAEPSSAAGAQPGKAEQPSAAGTEPVENIDELRQKAKERDQYLDMLQRTTADFLNYQKRMRKERETLRQTALRDFIEALLPALDNLDHAIAAAENSPDKALLEGVKLARDEVLRVLGNFGVRRMSTAGAKFDPNFHEAVMVEQTDKVPHQTVVEELRAGYTLDDKVVRAAQVKVAHNRMMNDE